jgi:hypothetical protein
MMGGLSTTMTTLSWVELAIRLLPPYSVGGGDGRIEPRRRIAQDLLEILACHQALCGFPGKEPGWREIMEIAERWWEMWLAANHVEEAIPPDKPKTVVQALRALADDIAAEFRQHGRQRVTAFFEWAMERSPDYQRPFPLGEPGFWR